MKAESKCVSKITAQKLKEAGFPQEPKIDISGIDGEFYGSFYYIVKPNVQHVAPNFLNQRDYKDYLKFASLTPKTKLIELIKIPTLSELIEACGDDFLGVNRTHDKKGK